ncbi:MAG: DUF1285 domain-containing protein [Rhodobacteraceae bacterium]|nr:DUF1285 domain-containing protein [Paracoccaceae bacterium]
MRPATPRHEAESRQDAKPDRAEVRLPSICGDLDMRIDRQGTWYYQGSPIGRHALVKLFATVLRRDEDGAYWLTTPVENGRIEVEDVPFIAVELIRDGQGQAQILSFRTNVDDVVVLGPDHPLHIAHPKGQTDLAPYIRVRGKLDARLARPVYYHLVELAEPAEGDEDTLGVWSSGHFYPIGRINGPDSPD